jgi:hypothetical protein
MMFKKTLVTAVLCWSALIPTALAQEPVPLTIRALAFSIEQRVDEAFAHDPAAPDGTPAVPVQIKTYLNHEVSQMVVNGGRLVFTTKPERSSLKAPADVIAEVTLPRGTRSAILLFMPGESGGPTKARVLVVPDTKEDFPPGSFRISNFSPLPVQIKLQKKDFNFQPGETHIIVNPPMDDTNHAGMEAFAFVNNKPRRIAASRWPSPGTGRNLAILFQHPVSKQVQLRSFDDVTPRDPPPIPVPE